MENAEITSIGDCGGLLKDSAFGPTPRENLTLFPRLNASKLLAIRMVCKSVWHRHLHRIARSFEQPFVAINRFMQELAIIDVCCCESKVLQHELGLLEWT